MISENKPEPEIDQDLYSRQLGAFGMEAMGKLIKLRVFIQGMTGVKIHHFSPNYSPPRLLGTKTILIFGNSFILDWT